MKKYYIIITILILIIIGLSIFIYILTHNFNEKVNDAKQKAEEYKTQLDNLKIKKDLSDKKFEKLSKEKKTIIYREVVKEKEKVIDLSEKILEENENNIKNWQKCEQKLKMKDFLIITGIGGIGFDQEWNMIGQAGLTINGKIYDGFFTKVYFGGGASYSFRTNFNEVIHGVILMPQFTILIGK